MRRAWLVRLVCAAALVAGCTSGDDGASTTAPTDGVAPDATEVVVGEDGVPVPDAPADGVGDAVLTGLRGGEVDLASYRGRPVVVNFWASTCAPCVQEMPDLEAVKQRAGDTVAFVGVAVNDRVDDALAFADDRGVTWDLATDPDGSFIAAVGGVVLPTTAILDADGAVVDVHGGQLTDAELVALLADAVGVDVPD